MKQNTFLNTKKVLLNKINDGQILFVGLPLDKGFVYRPGAAEGPKALRKTSLMYYYPDFSGLYDPESRKYILSEIDMADLGNIKNFDNLSFSQAEDRITGVYKKIFENHSIPISLGGNHSISFPILKAITKDVEVIQFDAHSDFQRYDESDSTPSGVVMRKINELKHVKRIIHCGIRGYLNSGQGIRDSIRNGNIVLTASDLMKKDGMNIKKYINFELPLYISLDADVFDPSICPGVTTPEPGGLNYRDVMEIIKSIADRGDVLGADIVEYNPRYDLSGIGAIHITKAIIDIVNFSSRNR